MAIVYDEGRLEQYVREAVKASPEHPILIDRFLEDAFEVDVDALGDGERVVIGGIMQHIEEAGIHSGDSAMVLPTYKIAPEHLDTIRELHAAAGPGARRARPDERAVRDQERRGLRARGQPARLAHAPFVSKATGVPLAKVAARIMAGRSAGRAGPHRGPRRSTRIFVKESVFPFLKFPGADILLGPEMKSTGEVMGISTDFGIAFAKAQQAAGYRIPTSGTRLHLGQRPRQGRACCRTRARSHEMGFAHRRHARHRRVPERATASPAEIVYKVQRGPPERRRPDQERRHPASCSTRRSGASRSTTTARSARARRCTTCSWSRRSPPRPPPCRRSARCASARPTCCRSRRSTSWRCPSEGCGARPLAPVKRPSPHSLARLEAALPRARRRWRPRGGARGSAAGPRRRPASPVAGIAGVSGGALVAAAWAGGADLDQLVEQASRLHPWMWVRGWGGGLLSGSKLGALIDEFVPVGELRGAAGAASSCWRPTSTPARPWCSARATCATRCAPRAASRASSRRYVWNGRRLVDGGVIEVVPVRLARELAGDDGVGARDRLQRRRHAGRRPTPSSRSRCARGSRCVRGRTRSRAGGRRPRDRARDRRVGLDAAARASRRSPRPARRRSSGRSRSCAACSGTSESRRARGRSLVAPWLVAGARSGRRSPATTGRGHRRRRGSQRPGLEARVTRPSTVAAPALRTRGLAAPPWCSIHGFGSSHLHLEGRDPRARRATTTSIALDLPGFGGSDRPADLSLEALPARGARPHGPPRSRARGARRATAWAERLRAIVAARAPERVSRAGADRRRRLQPGARATRPPIVRAGDVVGRRPSLGLLPGKRLIVASVAARRCFHDDALVHATERVAEYLAPRRSGRAASRRCDRSGSRCEAARSRVAGRARAGSSAPTLVIWGDDDRWIPLADADRFVAAIAGARKAVIAGLRPHAAGGEAGARSRASCSSSSTRA